AILNCTVLIFALCLEILGIPLFLGAPSNIDFYASYLYRSWSSGATPDPSFVSAGAVVLLVVVSGLLIIRARLSGPSSGSSLPAHSVAAPTARLTWAAGDGPAASRWARS